MNDIDALIKDVLIASRAMRSQSWPLDMAEEMQQRSERIDAQMPAVREAWIESEVSMMLDKDREEAEARAAAWEDEADRLRAVLTELVEACKRNRFDYTSAFEDALELVSAFADRPCVMHAEDDCSVSLPCIESVPSPPQAQK